MSLRDVASAAGAEIFGDCEDGQVVQRVCTDSREVRPGDLFVAIRGKNHDAHAFVSAAAANGAVACIVDKLGAEVLSTPLAGTLVVDDTVSALGRLATYYRHRVMHVGTTVIAITGSNGKTTTKGMIDHVLRQGLRGFASPRSFNNNIGVPLTILMAGDGDQYVVAEVGTNAPGEIASLSRMLAPHVGVITSIGEAHLEGLGSIDGVAVEKAALLAHVLPGGLAVVNTDRPEIRPFVAKCRHARVLTVGADPSARLTVSGGRTTLTRTSFELEGRYRIELPMPGSHHATNAAAAFAVARWLGMGCAEIIGALATFAPIEGRTRRLEVAGVTVIDDAYNANPASVLAAVEALRSGTSGRRVFILGDMLELGRDTRGFHDHVVRAIADSGIEVLIGVGHAVAEAVRRLGPRRMELHLCDDAPTACKRALTVVRQGDAVWIKASRSMQLDKVVQALLSQARGGRPEVCDSRPVAVA